MDHKELEVNVAILEGLGWFIAEDEIDSDIEAFEYILNCCRPDGSPLERVPVSDWLLSVYDEQEGSLEERLWFFAPKYSTNLDNIWEVVEKGAGLFINLLGPFDDNPLAHEYRYRAAVSSNSNWAECVARADTPALALCEAYLIYESHHRR